jgi:hypothetical protein
MFNLHISITTEEQIILEGGAGVEVYGRRGRFLPGQDDMASQAAAVTQLVLGAISPFLASTPSTPSRSLICHKTERSSIADQAFNPAKGL